MGRIYTVSYAGTIANASGNVDLLEVLPADDKPVKLRGLLLSQISEVADAAEEGLEITIRRLDATVTSGNGTSVTPKPMDSANTAAGFTAECNAASIGTSTVPSNILAEVGWNIRNSPYELWFPDVEFAPKVKGGEALVVRMETTAADDFTGCFTFWLEEE